MITLGEFKKFLAICGYPQAGGGTNVGKPAGVLAQSGVAVPLTGTTSETVLATITVPAGAMGVNGVLRITPLWSVTNNANNKTGKVAFGGTTIWTPSMTTSGIQGQILIRNRGVANSQIAATGGSGIGAGTLVTSAINTATAQNITILGSLANAADTISLEGYVVELLNP